MLETGRIIEPYFMIRNQTLYNLDALQAEIYLIELPNKQQYYFLYLVDFCNNHGRSDFRNINLL